MQKMHSLHSPLLLASLTQLQHADNEVFSLPSQEQNQLCWSTSFQSASQLAEALGRLGKSFQALQLTTGSMHGHFAVVQLSGLSIISISTNQLLMLNGERGNDCSCFCLEISGTHQDHRVHGIPIAPCSLHGFKPDLSESHFHLTAGSTTYFAITSSSRFGAFLERCGHEQLRDTLENSNSLLLSDRMHREIKQRFSWHLKHPLKKAEQRSLHTGNIYTLLMQALAQQDREDFQPFQISPRQHLVNELVRWGFQNSSNPISLDQLGHILFSSRRTLIQGCKENFNMGPMELIKVIRLEQVNWVLRSEERRLSLQLNTVGEIAEFFGFHSRGHFSAAYRKHFQEMPRQTFSNAIDYPPVGNRN